jgi:hypothetical protein
MVTQRIANPYDQHTLHSKVPVKESIILQSNLQAISWDTPGTPGNKIFFIYLASGFGVVGYLNSLKNAFRLFAAAIICLTFATVIQHSI